ncbi:MAG: Gfo/Idh/MocA family oxidoreductase [Thermodesulfovibrio sp.]|nr:Gfo/Idh/MocA family oxidoreductase [Thermodesulfovibrio sp.]
MKYKIAVIGAGYFGQRHIKILSQMEDVEIVGIADKDINRARESAKDYGLKYTDDFKELTDRASIFFIVTPTDTHFEIASELIKEGKDLFVEKPLVENPSDAMWLLREAKKRKIILQVGLIERFNPVVISLIRHIKNPAFITAQRISPFLGRATDTDVTFDLMIHDMDLIWMIFRKSGKPAIKDLKSFKKSLMTSKIDIAAAWLDLEINGKSICANLLASRISSHFQRTLSIIDEGFSLHADLINKKIVKINENGSDVEIPIKNKDSNALYEEIRDFLRAVDKRRLSSKAPSFDDIVEVLKIINHINGGITA